MNSNLQQKITRGILILSLGFSLLWSGCDKAALAPGLAETDAPSVTPLTAGTDAKQNKDSTEAEQNQDRAALDEAVTGAVNLLLRQLTDNVDDPDTFGSGGANLSTAEEKALVTTLIAALLEKTTALVAWTPGKALTQHDFQQAREFYAAGKNWNFSDAAAVERHYQSLPLTAAADMSQETFYRWLFTPQLRDAVELHGTQLTLAELQQFYSTY